LIGEEIDGEVVMIDLGSGVYYSLRGGSVVVWRLLTAGTDRDQLTAALADTYDAGATVIAEALDGLLAAMDSDGLIVEGTAEPGAPTASVGGGSRAAFVPLEFERFDDMAHVIQLDPVHDVDPERGWPLALD